MRKRICESSNSVVLQAFHGAKQHHSALKPSLRGTFGSGIYLADDFAAQQYAGEEGVVLATQVTLHAPYYYRATFEHDVDLDSPAVDLVRQLFSWSTAESLLQSAMATDAGFGREIQVALEERDFDGLIVEYQDGSKEIVAYNSGQVLVMTPQPDDTLAPEAC